MSALTAFDFFDDIWCIHHRAHRTRRPVMEARLARLGIGDRTQHVTALASPGDPRVGRVLTHRRLIQDAAERSLRSVLVIEDETLFLDRTEAVLQLAATELRGRDWRLLNLGTWRGVDHLVAEPGCAHLVQAGGRAAPFAVAYGAASYDGLLASLPVQFGAMADYLGEDNSIDGILAALSPAFVVSPAIATTPEWLPHQDPADQQRFMP